MWGILRHRLSSYIRDFFVNRDIWIPELNNNQYFSGIRKAGFFEAWLKCMLITPSLVSPPSWSICLAHFFPSPKKAAWWFQSFLFSSPGKWSTLTNIFSNGLVQPPTTYILSLGICPGVSQQKSSSRLQMTNRKQWPKTRRGTGWGSIPEVRDLRLTLTGLLAWYLVPFVCWCVCVCFWIFNMLGCTVDIFTYAACSSVCVYILYTYISIYWCPETNGRPPLFGRLTWTFHFTSQFLQLWSFGFWVNVYIALHF